MDAHADGTTPGGRPGLTPSEDRELRQLTWFSRAGQLSEKTLARLAYLMARDRRREVRDPRPDPSDPGDDDPRNPLPPPGLDRGGLMKCPNCGTVLTGTDALPPPRVDPNRLVFKSTDPAD